LLNLTELLHVNKRYDHHIQVLMGSAKPIIHVLVKCNFCLWK
jgi:hypothetical protein